MFYCADIQAQAYEESWDVVLGATQLRGFAFVSQDVFGFLFTAGVAGDEVTFIRKCRQVRVHKHIGTGEEIRRNQKVYATLASNFQTVTANPAGVIGVDYYYCGVAKKDAEASDETVLIDFDGTQYNYADNAA